MILWVLPIRPVCQAKKFVNPKDSTKVWQKCNTSVIPMTNDSITYPYGLLTWDPWYYTATDSGRVVYPYIYKIRKLV